MEFIRGNPTEVAFSVPTDSTAATYQVFRQGVEIGSTTPVTPVNGVVRITPPWGAVYQDGAIEIRVKFYHLGQEYELTNIFDVVTPYLPLENVKNIIESNDISEAFQAEASARHIINAHCGQTFGKFVGKISVTGGGEANLRLPRRLISYNSINGNSYWPNVLSLRGNGWFLQPKYRGGPPPIRADIDGYHYEPNSGVITAPPVSDYSAFARNVEYEIDGVWGWNEVPTPVSEAAKLLINDYACGDSLYRDRFLTSMTAADWRIQFHDGAFANTGNVRANQLLSEFTLRRGWAIL